MQTILITGINGFLGSSIARKLSNSYIIVGLESPNSNNMRLMGYNFRTYFSSNPLDTIFTDQHVDYIIHTATLFDRNNISISEMIASNIQLPVKLIENATKFGVRTFINTHTSLPRNTSNYSLSKSQFLDWLLLSRNKMQIINVLPEHFYGPEAGDTNFITAIIKKMLANAPFIDLTPGEQHRDFLYIDDLVEAYNLIISNLMILPSYSEFEIGSGETHTIKEVALMIHQLTQSSTLLNFGALPYRENEFMKSESNNSRIIALGWKPAVGFKNGISSMIDHYRNKL